MKVLLVHNRYQQRGGEDAVLEDEQALLAASGAKVETHEVSNDEIASLAGRAGAFLRAARNDRAIAPLLGRLRDTDFDVVHVHNFFPLLSPYLHRAVAQIGLPVVQTLHNYRLVCANGLLMRNDTVCEACLGSRHHALVHRCYRGSLMGTLAVLGVQSASIRNPAWIDAISRFIVLTEFAKSKFASLGIPASKLVVKANSTRDPGPGLPASERSGALFVGRIAPGKGVGVLLQAWRALPHIPLTIVGDGPEMDQARAQAPANVTFAGPQSREEVLAHMKRAAFLVMPSTWFEGLPVTLIEALACGLPVIASRLGSLPELVEHGRTGFLFAPGDTAALAGAVRQAFDFGVDRNALCQFARATYEERYRPEINAARLLSIYREAIALQAVRG